MNENNLSPMKRFTTLCKNKIAEYVNRENNTNITANDIDITCIHSDKYKTSVRATTTKVYGMVYELLFFTPFKEFILLPYKKSEDVLIEASQEEIECVRLLF